MADAPEIDGVVYLEGGAGLLPGDLVEVEITGADAHDLYAGPA
jgi:ribosomal protein S12 methylthiotransferase